MTNNTVSQNIPLENNKGIIKNIPMAQPASFNNFVRFQLPQPGVNNAKFYRTTHFIEGKKHRMLHVSPNFYTTPQSFSYDIYGSDGFRLEESITINKSSSNKKLFFTFSVTLGETYFIKVIAHYQNGPDRNYGFQEFILFYRLEDDFEQSDSDKEEDDMEISKKQKDPNPSPQPTEENNETDENNETEEHLVVTDKEIDDIKNYLYETTKNTGLNFKGNEEEEDEIDYSTL